MMVMIDDDDDCHHDGDDNKYGDDDGDNDDVDKGVISYKAGCTWQVLCSKLRGNECNSDSFIMKLSKPSCLRVILHVCYPASKNLIRKVSFFIARQ